MGKIGRSEEEEIDPVPRKKPSSSEAQTWPHGKRIFANRVGASKSPRRSGLPRVSSARSGLAGKTSRARIGGDACETWTNPVALRLDFAFKQYTHDPPVQRINGRVFQKNQAPWIGPFAQSSNDIEGDGTKAGSRSFGRILAGLGRMGLSPALQ